MFKNRRMPLWSASTPRDVERERMERIHSDNNEALGRYAEELEKICKDMHEDSEIEPRNLLKAKSVIESAMNAGDFSDLEKGLMEFVIRQIDRKTGNLMRNSDDKTVN